MNVKDGLRRNVKDVSGLYTQDRDVGTRQPALVSRLLGSEQHFYDTQPHFRL
jgi:hypothetical protein